MSVGTVVSTLEMVNVQELERPTVFVATHWTYDVPRLDRVTGLVTLHDWLRIPSTSEAWN